MTTKSPNSNLVPIGAIFIGGGIVAQKPLDGLLNTSPDENKMLFALLSDGMRLIVWVGIIFLVLGFYRNMKAKKAEQASVLPVQ